MRLLTALVALAALSACGKKDGPASPSANETKATVTAAPTNTGANSDAANALRATQEKVPMPDLGVPKANYTPVDRAAGDQWATYIAVALSDSGPDDKELLNLFSPRYFNEPDAFKKQEIATSELGPIKERLAAYKKQRYYSIPFGHIDPELMNPAIMFNGPYDFAKKSFPLGGNCGLSGGFLGNRQNISIGFGRDDQLCQLRVEDVETAKKIEALRASQNAHLRGVIYFFVQKVKGGNQIATVPTSIAYELWDKPSYLKGGNRVGEFEEKL